jgi:predicted ribosomally synthesized peptide with SipW-like signal peptide
MAAEMTQGGNNVGRVRKALFTVLVLGIVTSVAGMATFAAFTSTTSNDGNVFAAGTVFISDNDSSSAMYNVSNKKPNDATTGCIKVTYQGSLPSDVKLYWTPNGSDTLSQYITLSIDKVTYASEPTFPGCGTPSTTANVFNATMNTLGTTYAGGISVYPGSQTEWDQNDAAWFKFTLTLQDNAAANSGTGTAKTTGTHSFTWEAHNQ